MSKCREISFREICENEHFRFNPVHMIYAMQKKFLWEIHRSWTPNGTGIESVQ
jgi:hypothetical protein